MRSAHYVAFFRTQRIWYPAWTVSSSVPTVLFSLLAFRPEGPVLGVLVIFWNVASQGPEPLPIVIYICMVSSWAQIRNCSWIIGRQEMGTGEVFNNVMGGKYEGPLTELWGGIRSMYFSIQHLLSLHSGGFLPQAGKKQLLILPL